MGDLTEPSTRIADSVVADEPADRVTRELRELGEPETVTGDTSETSGRADRW